MIAKLMLRMIQASEGNRHDIEHFVKVHNYARTIGKMEGLPEDAQLVLEMAAILHDIACPLCRAKYGNTNGKLQELEGMPLAKALLQEFAVSDRQAEQVVWLVGHHHTLTDVNTPEHRILLEADYLVNAGEGGYSPEKIMAAGEMLFKTAAGKALLKAIYQV